LLYVARIGGILVDPIARLCICRCSCTLAEPFNVDDDDGHEDEEVAEDEAVVPLIVAVVVIVAVPLRSM